MKKTALKRCKNIEFKTHFYHTMFYNFCAVTAIVWILELCFVILQ